MTNYFSLHLKSWTKIYKIKTTLCMCITTFSEHEMEWIMAPGIVMVKLGWMNPTTLQNQNHHFQWVEPVFMLQCTGVRIELCVNVVVIMNNKRVAHIKEYASMIYQYYIYIPNTLMCWIVFGFLEKGMAVACLLC